MQGFTIQRGRPRHPETNEDAPVGRGRAQVSSHSWKNREKNSASFSTLLVLLFKVSRYLSPHLIILFLSFFLKILRHAD